MAQKKKLPVLVYHNIRFGGNESMDSLVTIGAEMFVRQMQYLHENGYRTLSSDEVIDFIEGKIDDEKVVALHFDDGWKTQVVVAPLFHDYKFKATFWVVPNFIGNRLDMMEWEQVKALSEIPSFDLNPHTMSHPCAEGNNLISMLANNDTRQLEYEISGARQVLETRIGKKSNYFAWPCGIYNESLIKFAMNYGYKGIFTTDDGCNEPGQQIDRIKRTMIHGKATFDDFLDSLNNGTYHNYN